MIGRTRTELRLRTVSLRSSVIETLFTEEVPLGPPLTCVGSGALRYGHAQEWIPYQFNLIDLERGPELTQLANATPDIPAAVELD